MEIRCIMAVKTNAVVSIMTNQFLVDHIHNLLKRQRTMSVKPHLHCLKLLPKLLPRRLWKNPRLTFSWPAAIERKSEKIKGSEFYTFSSLDAGICNVPAHHNHKLHEAFGFCTSKQIVPVKKMRNICAQTKKTGGVTCNREKRKSSAAQYSCGL